MPRSEARLGLAAALAVSALIVGGIALVYLAQSVFSLFEQEGFRPPAAALLTGGCGLALAAMLGLLGRLILHSRAAAHPAAGAQTNGVADVAADIGAFAARQLVNAAHEHPHGTVGAALAAGLAVGAIPELRKTLTGLLKH
jgi:hypothetical protein